MHCHQKRLPETGAVRVEVKVDVAKIVRCACFAGIAIVGIIFGTKAWIKSLELGQRTL